MPLRTGTARHWGASGTDHVTIARHDTAGLGLKAAKWLVEENGAMAVGSDMSGLERLTAERVYEFAYSVTTNAIRETVAGTALRPLAMR